MMNERNVEIETDTTTGVERLLSSALLRPILR